MMKSGVIFSYKLNWMSIMLCFIGSCCTFDVHGQIMSMPSFLGSSAQSAKSDHPTVITAMTMDFDLENNLADFMGNVVIDDSEMVIECDRMKIFLDDKDQTKSSEKETEGSKTDDKKDISKSSGKIKSETALDDEVSAEDVEDDKENEKASLSGSKKVSRVECIGNVVITRKQDSVSEDNEEPQEKATAGKVVYYCERGVVDLLEKPVVYTQDNKKITGRVLTVFLNEGGRIKITMGKIEDYSKTSIRNIGK